MVTPPRDAASTVGFIDQYWWFYRSLFSNVRHFESFKYLHLGMLSEIPRKSLPAIARISGLKDGQSLHHFLRDSNWQVEDIRETRLWLTKLLNGVLMPPGAYLLVSIQASYFHLETVKTEPNPEQKYNSIKYLEE